MKLLILVALSVLLQLSSCQLINQVGLRPGLGGRPSLLAVANPHNSYHDDIDDFNDEEPSKKGKCVCPQPERREQDEAEESDNSGNTNEVGARKKAVNLVLTALKLALKTQLSSYNTVSGGFIFRVIDKLIPTDPTPMDGLNNGMDMMDPAKLGSILLDQVVKKVPVASTMMNTYKDPHGAAYNMTKQELSREIPRAAATFDDEDPSNIPQ
jgi:hypothetical protein